MHETLMKFQTRKKFGDYEKSVNNLYNMYYEMLEKPVKDELNVYDKANELDEYYKDIKGKEPEKFCDVRYLIIEDYKEFNSEYIKESHKDGKLAHSPLTLLNYLMLIFSILIKVRKIFFAISFAEFQL